MNDKDERDRRAGSAPRHLDNSQQNLEIDTVAKLISEYEYGPPMGDRELLELLKKLENSLKRNPANCTKGPRFISSLLIHTNMSIRKTAFTCALAILSSPQNPRQMLLDAYRLALCCSNYQVAQYALSLLPDFVKACPEEANNLLKFGSVAHSKLPAPSTETEQYLSRAISIVTK